jgi:hypothetical protein
VIKVGPGVGVEKLAQQGSDSAVFVQSPRDSELIDSGNGQPLIGVGEKEGRG